MKRKRYSECLYESGFFKYNGSFYSFQIIETIEMSDELYKLDCISKYTNTSMSTHTLT